MSQDGGGVDGLGALHAAARDGDARLVRLGLASCVPVVSGSLHFIAAKRRRRPKRANNEATCFFFVSFYSSEGSCGLSIFGIRSVRCTVVALLALCYSLLG